MFYENNISSPGRHGLYSHTYMNIHLFIYLLPVHKSRQTFRSRIHIASHPIIATAFQPKVVNNQFSKREREEKYALCNNLVTFP